MLLLAPYVTDGVRAYSTEYPVRCVPGTPFKPAVVTCDEMNIVVIGADKGSRDAIFVFHARNGSLVNKIPLKQSATKVRPPTFTFFSLLKHCLLSIWFDEYKPPVSSFFSPSLLFYF